MNRTATKPKLTLPQTSLVLPIVDVNEQDAFVDEKGRIIDIIQIPCSDLLASKEFDVHYSMYSFMWFYKNYNEDFKIVAMNYPVDVHSQVKFIDHVLQRTENPRFTTELTKEKDWLTFTRERYGAKEYYLMVFSKDEASHKVNLNMLLSYLGKSRQVKTLRLGKKIQILFKLLNMNSPITSPIDTKDLQRGFPARRKYNPHLVSLIQPIGGVSFRDERIIKKGDGFEACIHIYDYPLQVRFNWLATFASYENTISTIDIAAEDKLKSMKDITTGIEEQQSRFMDARYATDKFDAQRVYSSLESLHERIETAGEVIKRVHIRMFVHAKTWDELDAQLSKITTDLESKGYKAAVFLDETSYEWKSLLLPFSGQDSLPNARKGKGVPSETLALGHPFHFSSLSDPHGCYLGYTSTMGTVFFDPYHKDKQRLSYSQIVLGLQGSGKSTYLKSSLKKDAIMGHYVRGFATNNEFHSLINYLGGIVINLDGSEGFLNVLQVYKTSVNETSSFIKHIEKVSRWYKCHVPEADQYDLMTLQKLLNFLYQQHMNFDIEAATSSGAGCITGKEPIEYPILSDLLLIVQSKMFANPSTRTAKSELSREQFSRLERIELALSTIVQNMGSIFNGHSSIRNFEKEQIVFFNVSGLLKLSPGVFDSQIFSAQSLFWDNMLAVGAPQKDLFDQGKLKLEDVHFFSIFMDEAHNFLNAGKPMAIADIDQFNREGRKFFARIILATHKLADFFPSNSTKDGVDGMGNIFSLTQYKLLFRQSMDSMPLIQQVFGDSLPANDVAEIASFEQGECLLNITGGGSIRLQVDIEEEELKLFSGGA